MKKFQNNKKLIETCSWILLNLAETNTFSRDKLAECGGFEVIVTAMRNFQDHHYIQHYGCRALVHLCRSNASKQGIRVWEAGACEQVVKALKLFGKNPDVQQYGCMAAFSLALKSKVNIESLLDCGAFDFIKKTMNNFEEGSVVNLYGAKAALLLADPIKSA